MLYVRHGVPQEQLSSASLREWQRYRGWKIRILEELEHSGGMTTREISSRTGYRCSSTGDRMREMLHSNLVEKVERWGWRITRDGIFLLSLNYTSTNNQQPINNPSTTHQQEKSEPAPKCFALTTCHIKRICQDKRYTRENMALCNGTASCVWFSSTLNCVPVEMKVRGVA